MENILRVQQALKNLICNVLLQVVTAISGLILPRLYLQIYGSALNGMVSSATQFMSYLSLVEAGISAASIVGLYTPLSQKDQTAVNEILSATKQFYTRTGICICITGLYLSSYISISSQWTSGLQCEPMDYTYFVCK